MDKLFAFAAAISVVFAAAPGGAKTAPMGWPEVIADLTTERTQAETCVGLIKSRGDSAIIGSAKATYVTAKGEMDGVIAGLETVLVEGGKPGSLPTVRPRLETTASSLKAICAAANKTAPANAKGVWDEIAKGVAEGAIEPVVDKISDGIAAIWGHYVVEPDKLALETKRSKLEAARWPEFADIAKK
jgi:hypothetical protein